MERGHFVFLLTHYLPKNSSLFFASKRQAYQPSGSKSNEKQASKSNSAASVLDFKKLPFVEKSLFASEDDMWKQLKDVSE